MADLKFIVIELNKPPFNKNYNLISFDSLGPEDLIQVMTDVLAELDPSAGGRIEVRTEEPEQTAVRLLTQLRILKYRPESSISPAAFRQGLVHGDRQIVHPILEWALKNSEELKKRAYLAQYLVKVDVPNDILGDADVAALHEQYERLVEEFKVIHKESESMRQSGNSTAELRADMESIDKERDMVTKKIERMMRKTEGVVYKEELLSASRELRVEKERRRELDAQRRQEVTATHQADQRLQLLTQQLRELRQASLGATPELLVQRLEEEASVTSYIVGQKLPRELERRRREVQLLAGVAADPNLAVNGETLDDLHTRIQSVSSEVNDLVQQHLVTSDPAEDKLAPFRQQAAIIARKKDTIAEEFSQLRSRLNHLQHDIQEKQAAIREAGGNGAVGGVVPRGEDFRKYVSGLRVRSTLYKRRRAELAQLKAEGGVLARTADLLTARRSQLIQATGEESCEATSDMANAMLKGNLEAEGRTTEQMVALLTQLQSQVSTRKAELAPLINDLRPLRERVQETTAVHEEHKRIYDRTSAALDSGSAKVEQEVRTLREGKESAESQRVLLSAKGNGLRVRLRRINEEMRLYVQEKGSGANAISLREKLVQRISEQERVMRQLRDEQVAAGKAREKCGRQRVLWSNLKLLLECKLKCQEEEKKKDGVMQLERGAETLVLIR